MKKKLTELTKANEEQVKKNTKLLGKLRKADNQMIELEKERRADKNQTKALKIQLQKAAKHAKTKQIICVTKEKEEEEDRSKLVEEEEYNCRDNMEDHSCREEQPGTEETIRVYLQMLKEEVEKKKVSVGFLDIETARVAVVHEQKLKEFLARGGKQGNSNVKHIMMLIKRLYDSTIYPLSQELDLEK
ncbi:hypothetical protein ACLB2K_052649 [Fragaria x ananassa]